MAFQRLNILAKKNSLGLHFSGSADSRDSPSTIAVSPIDSPSHLDRCQDMSDDELHNFGAKLERCKGSPGKESLSRRNKLFGSLRSLRSLTALHPSPRKTRQDGTDYVQSPAKYADLCTTPILIPPSLALLQFEQSPADKPIFELNLSQKSPSVSSLEVQHSSPVAVPKSAKQMTAHKVPPYVTEFPSGTIPGTPGPMQRAFDCDPANHVSRHNASPIPMEICAPRTPVLTPFPGTELSVEDVDSESVLLPPSINPSTVHLGQENSDYFGNPCKRQLQMDNADTIDRQACLAFADVNDCSIDSQRINAKDTKTHICNTFCDSSKEPRYRREESTLRRSTDIPNASEEPDWDFSSKQRTGPSSGFVHNQTAPQHHRTLPLRLKRNDKGQQDSSRKESGINKDGETGSGEPRTKVGSAPIHEHQDGSNITGVSDHSDVLTSSTEVERSKGGRNSCVNSACIAQIDPQESGHFTAQNKSQEGDISLYDGSGYGDDSGGPTTPYEPDEGIKEVYLLFNPRLIHAPPTILPIDRVRREKKRLFAAAGGEEP